MKINAKRVWAALIALAMLLTIAPCAMAEVDKKEVVYVLADANGNTNQVIVSERLYNSAAETEIHDVSRLTDIENLSGDETFTRDGDSIVWAANGAQISYEGNSTEALPFGVKIAYTLDGAEIAAIRILLPVCSSAIFSGFARPSRSSPLAANPIAAPNRLIVR